MIPKERHEGRELHPSVTQLLIGVSHETTSICPDKRDLKQLELQSALDIEVHVLPFAHIVA